MIRKTISIVIPVLNEEQTLGSLLNHLTVNSTSSNIKDIIVVDGGSTDGTQNIARSFKNIVFITSEKGRAKQLNSGANIARGNVLYFLHADSLPPKNFDQYILTEISSGRQAGCFRMEFDSNHWWLQITGWLTQFNLRACRGGDQSQFITSELFRNIGGYDESYTIYEDIVLINTLYAINEFVVINKKLKTSARLYQKNGVWRTQYHFLAIYIKKWLGASADDLCLYYKKKVIS